MNKNLTNAVFQGALGLALITSLGACSSSSKSIEKNQSAQVEPVSGHPATGNSLQTKFVAAEQEAHASAELKFAPGSAKLPKDAKGKIEKALREASARSRVNEVKVITWADQEYPSTQKEDLSAAQRNLSAKRADAIASLLSEVAKDVKVEKVNMAERPGMIASLFKTSDFRVKRSLERAGIPTENTSVKVPAMERKALLLFLNEDSDER
ncbi:MAG: hypothetical protein EOP11_14515 [Proteobacteria bacterium]|nr:MAG: hypothetical protein EOP11_14515 [Pseudomonadota bacterium]